MDSERQPTWKAPGWLPLLPVLGVATNLLGEALWVLLNDIGAQAYRLDVLSP